MRLACLATFLACGSAPMEPAPEAPYVPPPERCDAPDLARPDTFVPCSTGGGVFGQWVLDDLGLPAYDYGLDQHADARARWFNTERKDRRDHWHAFGNARISAMLSNDGFVEVTTQDRGVTYLDKVDEEKGAWGGGWSVIDDGGAVWSTAYRFRPRGSRSARRFGMGYAEAESTHRGIRVRHRYVSPPGDAPVVVDEVLVENVSDARKTFVHFEVWDVARRPIETNWLVSGSALASVPANVRAARDARNAAFTETVSWDADARVLGLRRAPTMSPPVGKDEPSAVNWYPEDPFLAVLQGSVTDVYTEQGAFFGDGGPSRPSGTRIPGDGILSGTKGTTRSGEGQPRIFVMRTPMDLGAHEMRTLRFAYGYAPSGEPFAVDPTWGARDLRREEAEHQRKHLLYFASERDPALHREMAWHASQIEVSVARRDYWGRRVVPQGSAYLYLHGADGALRDLGLFAVPLVYTDAALAREELLLAAGMQRASDRQFSYAFQGHGVLDDASGIHSAPSDLDLFFLWGVAEYVHATGDLAFLDAPAPYWPREAIAGATLRDHVRDAVRHLFDVVGTGEHGLIRVGTGDWSDGIVFEAPDRALAVAKGESVPNTQMALWVLPRVAGLVSPALEAEIAQRVADYRAALASAWAGEFYGRAYFGDGLLRYANEPNLEAQVWPLIAGAFASDADRNATVAVVARDLDEPSPTGATLVKGGQVWPAISGLLTWGWAEVDAERAWKHLARNTLAAHAITFPTIWYGIWSAPDGMKSTTVGAPPQANSIDTATTSGPGEAWYSVVTPMTDFPVMNANAHTMPMLAALRVAGLTPQPGGLRLAPHLPGGAQRKLALRTELIDVDVAGPIVRGAYRPRGARTLEVVPGGTVVRATVDGKPTNFSPGAKSVLLDLPEGGGSFEVEGGP